MECMTTIYVILAFAKDVIVNFLSNSTSQSQENLLLMLILFAPVELLSSSSMPFIKLLLVFSAIKINNAQNTVPTVVKIIA